MHALVLLVAAGLGGQEKSPLGLDDLTPHAAGVCLAEVLRFENYDGRPYDGGLLVVVKLKIARGSGDVKDTIDIIKEAGDDGNEPSPPINEPIAYKSLKKGQRYWLAFASPHDGKNYPQGIVRFWKEKTPAVAKLMDDAIKTDRYRWKPQYDSDLDLAYGHLIEKDKKQWRIRVERKGEVLWEKVIPGEKSPRFWDGLALNEAGYYDMPTAKLRLGKMLISESAQTLDDKNEYELPAGKYVVSTAHDLETGKRLAAWVSPFGSMPENISCRDYDPATGKLRGAEDYRWKQAGGKVIGAAVDHYWQKTLKLIDRKTGQTIAQQVYREDRHPDGSREWVRIMPRD